MNEDQRIREINAFMMELGSVVREGKELGIIKEEQVLALERCVKTGGDLIMQLRKRQFKKTVNKLAEEKRFPKD